MDAYDLVIRKFVRQVVDIAKAEIQGFADALEAWLGDLWDEMPRNGWREDLDQFVERWAAQGIVAEPDDVRDLKNWIAEFERQAIERQQAAAAQQRSDAVVIPLPSGPIVPEDYEERLLRILEAAGQSIMATKLPDDWLTEAEKIVELLAPPAEIAKRFLDWIAAAQDQRLDMGWLPSPEELAESQQGQTDRAFEDALADDDQVRDSILSPAINDDAAMPSMFASHVRRVEEELRQMKTLTEALGNKYLRAPIEVFIEAEDECDAILQSILRYNVHYALAIETALVEGQPSSRIERLHQLPNPSSFGLPLFFSKQAEERVRAAEKRLSAVLKSRLAIIEFSLTAATAVNNAGKIAGVIVIGTSLVQGVVKGGAWGLTKVVAVMLAGQAADRAVEYGAEAVGATDQQVSALQAGVQIVTLFLAYRISGGRAAGRRARAQAEVAETAAPGPAEPTPRGPAGNPKVAKGNLFNRLRKTAYPYRETYVETSEGGRYRRLDGYDDVLGEIVSRKATQLAAIGEKSAIAYIREVATKYSPGTKIADVPTSGPLAGKRLGGKLFLEVPVQVKPVPQAVLDAAKRFKVTIRDVYGRVYNNP